MCPNPLGFYQWDQQFFSALLMSHSEIPLLFATTSWCRSAHLAAICLAWKGFGSAWSPLQTPPCMYTCVCTQPCSPLHSDMQTVHSCTQPPTCPCVCSHRCMSTRCTHLEKKKVCMHPIMCSCTLRCMHTHTCKLKLTMSTSM